MTLNKIFCNNLCFSNESKSSGTSESKSAQILQKKDEHNMYVIMKTMYKLYNRIYIYINKYMYIYIYIHIYIYIYIYEHNMYVIMKTMYKLYNRIYIYIYILL